MNTFQNIIIEIKKSNQILYYFIEGVFKENKWFIEISKEKLIPIYLGSIYNDKNEIVILKSIKVQNHEDYLVQKEVRGIMDLIYKRYLYHLEFERVLLYSITSSKLDINSLDPYSEIFKCSNLFDFEIFKRNFKGFDSFLEKSKSLNIMVAGSSVLYSCTKRKWLKHKSHPNDIDLYIHFNADQKQTLLSIDNIIREIYNDSKIKMIRSPYVLTYFILKNDKILHKWGYSEEEREFVTVTYQIILSPCKRWEHVFAGYHSDIVCAGYLCNEQKFVTTTRFDYWVNDSKIPAYFFPDLVSPRYRDRVSNAYEKYRLRKFEVVLVGPFDELRMADVERSPKLETIFYHKNDIAPYLQKMEDICSIGDTLQQVYEGEAFQSIIETMACFRSCPVCGTLVFCAEKALYCEMIHTQKKVDSGCFCNTCFQKELSNLKLLEETLTNKIGKKSLALVTGGRCGLGKEVMDLLIQNGVNTLGTTRFPLDEKLIKLDLKDSSTWSKAKELLESGMVNILILSASETLHYPDDDKLSDKWDPKKYDEQNLDWTNDFQRKNSGVWHKTLDKHSYNEIVSPLMTNIAGNASLLSFFLNGVKNVRSQETLRCITKKKFFCCIVVTSYEGTFESKTPFHPITNACKSALEQIVWTVKDQADFLDCKVLLSDPGWVYTEGSFGKFKGPVPIKFGACQILQPLVTSINFHDTKNAQIFRRDRSKIVENLFNMDNKCVISVKIKLEPCGHIIDISNNYKNKLIETCPICYKYVSSRNLVDYEPQKMFILICKKYKLPKYIINIILIKASFPPIEGITISYTPTEEHNIIKEDSLIKGINI